MGTDNKPVNNADESSILKPANGSPVRCFTNAWLLTNLGLFHIYMTVIGPQAEDPEYRLPLPSGEAQTELEAIADLIEALKEQLR